MHSRVMRKVCSRLHAPLRSPVSMRFLWDSSRLISAFVQSALRTVIVQIDVYTHEYCT
jgi:hypothetical protein